MDMPRFSHTAPFDPTYGYSFEQLLAMPRPTPPPDFAEFWRRQQARARAIPPRVEMQRLPDVQGVAVEVHAVSFDSLDDMRIGGWLTRPLGRAARGAMIIGHGYGGRDAPELAPPLDDVITLQPCARGFHRSASPRYPGTSAFHVVHGIERRETYIHLGSCADLLWCAANALLSVEPGVADRLDYWGVSFGGGIGAMALPWDDRFRRACLEVPSFGHHDFRLSVPCWGSGEAVRLYHQRRPEVQQVLAYFDSANSTQFLRTPTHFGLALFDPSVPPPGQFAVHNAAACEKAMHVRQAGHFDYPQALEDTRQLRAAQRAWLNA
jgi:cephalosporin-C deacetylase